MGREEERDGQDHDVSIETFDHGLPSLDNAHMNSNTSSQTKDLDAFPQVVPNRPSHCSSLAEVGFPEVDMESFSHIMSTNSNNNTNTTTRNSRSHSPGLHVIAATATPKSRFRLLISQLVEEHESEVRELRICPKCQFAKGPNPGLGGHTGSSSSYLGSSVSSALRGHGHGHQAASKTRIYLHHDDEAFETSPMQVFALKSRSSTSHLRSSLHSSDGLGGNPEALSAWERMTRDLIAEDFETLRGCWTEPECLTSRTSDSREIAAKVKFSSKEPTDPVLQVWQQSLRALRWTTNTKRTWMLHPDSALRVLWSFLGVTFLVFDLLVLSFSVFGIESPEGLEIADLCYWLTDMILTFRTGVYVHGKVDFAWKTIARRYFSTWFLFDAALLSYQAVIMNSEESQGFRYFRIFRLGRLIKLAKLDMMYGRVLQLSQSVYVTLCVKMALYMMCLMMWIHGGATVWYWIATSAGPEEESWLRRFKESNEDLAFPMTYFLSANWAVCQLQGSCDISPKTPLERAFAALHGMGSCIALALLMGKLAAVMQAMASAKNARQHLVTSAHIFMREHKIQGELCIDVQRFLVRKARFDARHQSAAAEVQVLEALPVYLRRALLKEARWQALERFVLFQAIQKCNARFIAKLCIDYTTLALHLPGEPIFSQTEVCRKLYYVDAGTACYTPSSLVRELFGSRVQAGGASSRKALRLGEYPSSVLTSKTRMKSGFVEEGSLLCEAAIWVRWNHHGDCSADTVSQVSLVLVELSSIIELLSLHSNVIEALGAHAERVLDHFQRHRNVDDLWTSEDTMRARDRERQLRNCDCGTHSMSTEGYGTSSVEVAKEFGPQTTFVQSPVQRKNDLSLIDPSVDLSFDGGIPLPDENLVILQEVASGTGGHHEEWM